MLYNFQNSANSARSTEKHPLSEPHQQGISRHFAIFFKIQLTKMKKSIGSSFRSLNDFGCNTAANWKKLCKKLNFFKNAVDDDRKIDRLFVPFG